MYVFSPLTLSEESLIFLRLYESSLVCVSSIELASFLVDLPVLEK